jgi:putative methionine-R-sulfoxide reductase with GAF domain
MGADGDVRLGQLIRTRRAAILARWEREVRSSGVAEDLPRPLLFNSMPDFVDALATTAERGTATTWPVESARDHAGQRLELGYDVGQVVREYGAMRVALIHELQDATPTIPLEAWLPVTSTLETAIGEAVERFSRGRDRKLRALERISTEVLQAPDLNIMLERVLQLLSDAIPVIDEVTVLLREGDELRVRASRGLEAELHRGFTVAVGDGFAGTIAARREPILLHDAAHDPLVKSEYIHASKLRALYGVPLVDADEVVGVAHMGSTLVGDFQAEDLLLFRAIANRVTTLLSVRRIVDLQRENENLRENFIGMLGHDLRTPLHAILGSAQLLSATGTSTRGTARRSSGSPVPRCGWSGSSKRSSTLPARGWATSRWPRPGSISSRWQRPRPTSSRRRTRGVR